MSKPDGEFSLRTSYPSVPAVPLTLFSLLIICWWLEVGTRRPFLAQIRFEFCLTAVVALMALFRAWSRQGRRRKSPVTGIKEENNRDIVGASVFLLAMMALNIPLAIDAGVAWDDFFNRGLKLAVIGFLIPQFVVSPFSLRVYLASLLVAFLKVGQEAFVGKLNGSMVWENQGIPRLHGTPGTTFGGPNSLSGRMVSAIPYVWYGFQSATSKYARIPILVMGIFIVNAVLFAGSRTGYLAAIVIGLLIWFFAKGRGIKKIFLLFLAAALSVAAVSFVPEAYKERFMSTFTGQEAEGRSSDTRKQLFFDSLRVPTEHPLGLGLGNFKIYQANKGRNSQDTHNLYTQVLAETGIQGFIGFSVFVWILLRKILRTRRLAGRALEVLNKNHTHATGDLAEPFAKELRDMKLIFLMSTALFVFVCGRLFLGLFGHDLLEMYWWMSAGLIMALHQMSLIARRRAEEFSTAVSESEGVR